MDLGSFQFQITVQMVNVDHWLSMLYFVDKDVDAFHAIYHLPFFCYSLMTIIHPEFPLLRILYHKSNHSCLLPKKKKINKMKIFWVWLGLENQMYVLLFFEMLCTLPTGRTVNVVVFLRMLPTFSLASPEPKKHC